MVQLRHAGAPGRILLAYGINGGSARPAAAGASMAKRDGERCLRSLPVMTERFDFDTVIDRHGTGSSKWSRYSPDILPMWVADMDYAVAPCILDALRARLDHPVFGYAKADAALRRQIVDEMGSAYGWMIDPEHIVFLPGVEPGFNMALKALLHPGDKVAVQTPVYAPILQAPLNWGLERVDLPLTHAAGWPFDQEAFRSNLAKCQAFLFCNPHNPTGKVFTQDELITIADACLQSGVLIISDEIHADLTYDGKRHRPIAALSEELAEKTITLMAASKTYNIAGLKTAFAIIGNRSLREAFERGRLGMVDSVNALGLVATKAAYANAGPWRSALLSYLQANRDYLADAVRQRLPGVTLHPPDGTFLAWLDCSALDLQPSPQAVFLDRGKIGLSAGAEFGREHFVRLNFGCPRSLLVEGVRRLEAALSGRSDLDRP